MTRNRREFLQSVPAVGAGLLGASLRPAALAAQSDHKRYHVLLMMVDGQASDLRSVLGGKVVPTPGLERLAGRGTWFSRAYCEAPGCCPSRIAMLTGVHASKSRIYYNNHRYRQATSAIARGSVTGEVEVSRSTTYLGTPGYPASDPELDGIFIASGAGIRKGARLERMRNLDVAPTIARLLRLELAAEGRALEEILDRN